MCVHVAVVCRGYARLILSGAKTIECRLSRDRRDPFGRVEPNDLVYFKVVSGPIVAEALVADVITLADLTPGRVRDLRAAYDRHIRGDAAYWASKRAARYATLMMLRGPRVPARVPLLPPARPGSRRAWHCLDAPDLVERAEPSHGRTTAAANGR